MGAGERLRRLVELKLRRALQRHLQRGLDLAAGGLPVSITQHSLLPAGSLKR